MNALSRIAALDWPHIEAELNAHGHATLGPLLDGHDCADLIGTWADAARFRSQVIMARHGFGRGEYRYFAEPLPEQVDALRASLYPPLAAIANRWSSALGLDGDYPSAHADFRRRCHAAGQTRPTPLLLRYGSVAMPRNLEAVKAELDKLGKMRRLPQGIDAAKLASAKGAYDTAMAEWPSITEAWTAGNLAAAMNQATAMKGKVSEAMMAVGLAADEKAWGNQMSAPVKP